MAAVHGASSSSSSYHVFLSFRGEDTRKSFTAHLYAALRRNGINTFMDDKLRNGEEISPALFKAIEDSEISIIVLSKNYASSRWCLEELTKILNCRKTRGQHVLPLFYHVDPSEIRNLTNTVREVFSKLEKRFKNDEMKVTGWRTALRDVANLSGIHLGNRNEPEFIDEIIGWVNSILVKKTYFQVAQYPVGIESRIQDLKSHLVTENNDCTCMVGIFGCGGIGKTTIAKAIYNSISSQFEGSCFLENIRETSSQKGMIHLQTILLSKILGDSNLKVDNVDQGITLIEQRLCSLRVLVILDDVDQLVQLEKLAGEGDWFGLGSRIIITTRDKHLLHAHGVDSTYQVNEMNHNEALQLFSWNAFKSDKPDDNFVELTEHVIGYAGGLPLALVVLGSDLSSKSLHEWKSALDRYKRTPNKKIQEILRISYDGLEDNVKDIFLDIACFFKGQKVDYISKILDKCGFFPDYGIKVLVDKSFVSIDKDFETLIMHDLLQELGREIVRQESPKEPGERSRLWFHEDVCHVLEENTGTNKVEGILIDLPEPDLIPLSSKAFKKMKRLRLFISRNACFSKEPNFLSNELRLLDWPKYPGEYFPSNFCGKNLIVLRMPHSQLKELEGVQNFQNMTIMDFTDCKLLRKIPDVSRIPNLEKLTLDRCKNLVQVDGSVGFLDKLIRLSLTDCYNLRIFPRSLKLRSLEFLSLDSCSRIKNFPEIECQMEYLEYINFRDTRIEELPSSIRYLVGTKQLNLRGCTNLTNLPDSICQLQHLECLNLKDCTSIKGLPSSIGYLVEVKKLSLRGCTNLLNLPNSIYQLPHLEHLSIDGYSKVVEFLEVEDNRQSMPTILSIEESEISSWRELLQLSPFANTSNSNDGCSPIASPKRQKLDLDNCGLLESNFSRTFDCRSTLTKLDLSGSDIVTLPKCIRRFVRLEILGLENCKQLREILVLPPNVKKVFAAGCLSLAIFLEEARRSQLFNTWDSPEPFGVGTVFPAQQSLNLGNDVLTEFDFLGQFECPFNLEYLDLSSSTVVSLPSWAKKIVGLKHLCLEDCKQLREIPELPPSIETIYLRQCRALERLQFNNIYELTMLRWIDLSDCPEYIRNDTQIQFLSEEHPKDHEFGCIFPGNKIPNCFSHCKEVPNTNWCEIDIKEPVHLDLKNTRFAFSAVIGTEDIQDFRIIVQVINDGQLIYFHSSFDICNSAGLDHVWLNYHGSHHSQLETSNLQVIFTCKDEDGDPPKSVFFKSCGFHLEQRYGEKAIYLMDDVQLSKRHRGEDDDDDDVQLSKRHRGDDDDDDGNLESN